MCSASERELWAGPHLRPAPRANSMAVIREKGGAGNEARSATPVSTKTYDTWPYGPGAEDPGDGGNPGAGPSAPPEDDGLAP